MKLLSFLIALLCAATLAPAATDSPDWATKDLRVGIIGTDTSHVPQFVELYNVKHPEWRLKVVAAYKGGSADIASSIGRVEKYAKGIQEKHQVEIVDSIDALIGKVDVVLLHSIDGRLHLEQVTPVMKAGKRVFIDKPLAASLEDARAIAALSQETGTPFFTASSYRFHPDISALREKAAPGKATKVQGSSPFNTLEHHPDLFFYGIHGLEALYAVMGPGCEKVSRTSDDKADITTGTWKDGRIGVYYGTRKGTKAPMIRVTGTDGQTTDSRGSVNYEPLAKNVAEFFQTGKPPVDPAETIEEFEFMTAAQKSKESGGAEVHLSDLRK